MCASPRESPYHSIMFRCICLHQCSVSLSHWGFVHTHFVNTLHKHIRYSHTSTYSCAKHTFSPILNDMTFWTWWWYEHNTQWINIATWVHVCCSSCIRICYRLLYASFFLNQLESEKNRLENLLSSNLLKRKEELQRVRNTLIVKLHICTRVFTLFLCACVLTCMFARVYNGKSVQPPYSFHLDSKGS